MTASNLQIVLKSRPIGAFSPSETFIPKTGPALVASDLKPGQVLIETLYVSLDPVMRKWLNEDSYLFKIQPGDPMAGPALSRVVASRVDGVEPGQLVSGWTGWVSYAIVQEGAFEKFEVPEGAKTTDALGVLGFTGLTGYFGMLRLGKPKKGETVVVSAAAGATGSVAAQIAKIQGAKVIGIAGSADKCAWLKELGVDVALDYKKADFEKQLEKAIEGGIDVYFDNVGGRILELAIESMKESGRIVICGDISGYDTDKPHRIKSLFPIAAKSVTVYGLNIFRYLAEAASAREELTRWLNEGKLKRTETILKGGLEAAPDGLKSLLEGGNIGKMLVEVKQVQ
ncbi:Fc.00g005500.m01.CDS01 [Cosmosporella sp. VM-42]